MITLYLKRGWVALVAVLAICSSASVANATVVRIATSVGNIDLRMFEGATPITVANFLNYINSNRYDGTFIHRSAKLPSGDDFVIQGGGYTYNAQSGATPHIPQFDQITNEPGISNLRGTIAMAKLAPPSQGGPPNGGPDSATSEWFLNLGDNSGPPPALDSQNGGFTVFGRIVFTGLQTMDAIAALQRTSVNGLVDVPVRTGATLADQLVYVNDVFVRTAIPAADYNFDAQVTIADFDVWKSTFGSTTNAAADGNGNGIVDAADYILWRNSMAAANGGGGDLGVMAVPEPGTAALILLAAPLLATLRRRRSR